MAENPEPNGSATPTGATIGCQQCGQQVPDLRYCVRCGDPLAPEQRAGRTGRVRDAFAAAPDERALAVRVISTLYPALPREEIRTFQAALIAGVAVVVVLGILGFFPVAIVAAAVLVPLLTVLYLYDVDTYEDEPVRVVAATFLWGAVAGVLFALALDQFFPVKASSIVGDVYGAGGSSAGLDIVRTIVAPVVAAALMALGPALLLRQRRFNDVLDGATFGVASAVAFTGAQTIVTSLDLFRSGLQPVGDVVPWVIRLLTLGVALPLIAAGAIGGFVGVLWLRYRGPDEHEDLLGLLGQPFVAGALALVLLVATALTQDLFDGLVALLLLALLAIVALVWLRRIIHLGLLQESLEIPVGPEIHCANCGGATPRHSFCGLCGVSLRALPKARPAPRPAGAPPAPPAGGPAIGGGYAAPHQQRESTDTAVPSGLEGTALAVATGTAPPPAAPAERGWLGARWLGVAFAVVLGAIVVVALIVAWVISQGLDQPVCPDPSLPCTGGAPVIAAVERGVVPRAAATADQEGPPFPDWERYTDAASGFSLEYDPGLWSVAEQADGAVVLIAFEGALAYVVETAPADVVDVDGIFEYRRDLLSGSLLAYAEDRAPARALLGNPLLGHRVGIGGLFGGTFDTAQGPDVDMTVASVAATDETVVAVATIIVPTEIRDLGLQAADSINNSFTWPSEEIPQ